MSDRKDEINCVLNLINSMCETANISLIPKAWKGTWIVAVKDETDGKEYAIARSK
jgi:hypothetical protein